VFNVNKRGYSAIPQPDEIELKEKEDAMGSYLMMFAAWGVGFPLPILNLLATFIYYMLNREKGKFVLFHIYQSLFTQVVISVLNAIAFFLFIKRLVFSSESSFSDNFLAFMFTLLIFNIVYFFISMIGAVKARKGKFYYIVFFGRLSYYLVFREKSKKELLSPVNMPPK